MNIEYELLQIISRNRAAILEDVQTHKTSDLCPLGSFQYLLNDQNLTLGASFSQQDYEARPVIQDCARGPLVKVLDNLKHALAVRPEHSEVWSTKPLPPLGPSKLGTAYYAEIAQNSLMKVFGPSMQRLLVESHGMVHKYVVGESDIAVTVFARWEALHHHNRTVHFPFPVSNATTLVEEFQKAVAFANEVVQGTRELIADDSYWPTLEDVRKCEREQAAHLTLAALDTLCGWQCDTALKHPDVMERALKFWIQEQSEKNAKRAQEAPA